VGPILAAFLFLRLGWDSTNAPCPILSVSFCGKGGIPQKLRGGCPNLAAYLFLRLRGPQRQVFVVGVN
jgi:hypothetical protein